MNIASNPEQCIPNSDNLLNVMLHIPKTSGTTIREYLKPHFKNDELVLCYDSELYRTQPQGLVPLVNDRTKLLMGHCHYGLHQYLSRPVQYHTILREPLARLISFYEYTRTREREKAGVPQLVTSAQENSVIDFFERVPEVYNGQCLYLSSDAPDDVDKAMENLSSMHFGIQDCTALFIQELANMFSLKPVVFRNKKVRKQPHSITADEISVLREKCQLDIELFERATSLFYQQRKSSRARLSRVNRRIERVAAVRYFFQH